MVKPIFIVILPFDNNLTSNELELMKYRVEAQINDYHVLIIQSSDTKTIDFKVFYEKDFNEVRYEELKEIIKNLLNGST